MLLSHSNLLSMRLRGDAIRDFPGEMRKVGLKTSENRHSHAFMSTFETRTGADRVLLLVERYDPNAGARQTDTETVPQSRLSSGVSGFAMRASHRQSYL
jgi:hypothetical protein